MGCHPQYPYARPAFVQWEHLGERPFGQDYLLAAGRGVEQLQLPVAMAGKAEVNHVQSGSTGGDAEDVAILNPGRAFVGDFVFGQVVDESAGKLFLDCFHLLHILGRLLQVAVGVGMGGHERELQEHGVGAALGCDVLDEAVLYAALYPFGDVVQARGIAVDASVTIADALQVVFHLPAAGVGQRLGQHVFHERGAIYLLQIHY